MGGREVSDTCKVTILNVDDHDAVRCSISEILAEAGFEVKEAANGREALRLVKEKPDLVILDVNLPDINGFEVCRQIKADPATASIPVLHRSAVYTQSKDRAQGLEEGADAYLTKTAGPAELVATVKALLRIRQAEEKAQISAQQWRATFDAISDGICLLDAEGRILRCNRALARLLKKPSGEIIGRTCHEVIYGITEENLPARLVQSCYRKTIDFPRGAQWFQAIIDPMLDADNRPIGAVHILTDITERKRAEEKLRQQNEYLTALHETTLGLMNRLEIDNLLEAMILRAGALIGTSHGFIYLSEAGEAEITMKVGVGAYGPHVGYRLKPGQGVSGKVWQTGQPLAVEDYCTWPGRVPGSEFDTFRAVVGVPLKSGSEVVGVIGLCHLEEGRTFGSDEVALLSRFAALASIALDNARLYTSAQRELAERKQVEDALRKAHDELELRVEQRTAELSKANTILREQIAERRRVEMALRESEEHYRALFNQAREMQDNLRKLSREVLRVQEEERKRISWELHDEVGQALTAINVGLEMIKKEIATDRENLKKRIVDLQNLVEQTIDSVHRFSRELRPAILDDLGLFPALRWYTKSFAERTGIQVHLKASPAIEKLDGEQKTVVYRVVQESLTNVSKHAQADKVDIDIKKAKNGICLEIWDDGKAFRVCERTSLFKGRGGLGILGMQERVEFVGGKFAMESEPGKGTTIRVEIPFKTERG